MSKSFAGLIAALTLGLGVIVGVAAGSMISAAQPSQSPAVALVSPSAAAPSGQPSQTPAASSSAEPSALPAVSPSPAVSSPPSASPGPTRVPDPLTGRLVSPAVARRHVVAVMIDDQFAARPQSGLSSASIVWQAPAEGGIPRYMAFFQEGNPKAVGPIRSSRYYFIAWASEWHATYVHVGGSPQALALLRSSDGKGKVVYDADGFRWEGRYLWRIHTRLAPHNVYTDGKNLRALAKRVGAKDVTYKATWKFGPEADRLKRPKGGTIIVPYLENRITYTYDRATNRYLRSVSVEGKQVDAGSKTRIGPKNVIVMVVSFGPLNDGSKKHRLEAKLIGRGTAWIATNGRTVKGTWRKKSLTGLTRFYGPNGKEVTLTVGQTFIQVIPVGTTITIKDGKVPPLPPRPAVGGHVDTGGLLPS
ncbi:MAG: DUF3048 domain-containing protein [Candidatus Limnocylindrales bacterium]